MKLKYCCLMLLASAQIYAKDESQDKTQTVVANGRQTDVEASRDFVAGKIIIRQKTLKESGVQNVADVLRREPAITVGKDGRIGLLGLPGYTQVLVDGQQSTGIDPYTMDLLQVEKIEIIKSATTGPFGIAGTINIIRRKADRKAMTQLRASGNTIAGHGGAGVTLMSNQLPSGTPLMYNFMLMANSKSTPSAERYRQTLGTATPAPQLQGERTALNRMQTMIANTIKTMTKFLIFIILGCTLQAATAQDKKQTRDQCMAKCLPLIAELNDHERHEQVLKNTGQT